MHVKTQIENDFTLVRSKRLDLCFKYVSFITALFFIIRHYINFLK